VLRALSVQLDGGSPLAGASAWNSGSESSDVERVVEFGEGDDDEITEGDCDDEDDGRGGRHGDDDGSEEAHPLQDAQFRSWVIARSTIRGYEASRGNFLKRLASGLGANKHMAVLVCSAQCPVDAVLYRVKIHKSGNCQVLVARSNHRHCVPKSRSLVAVLAENPTIKSMGRSRNKPVSTAALKTTSASQGMGAHLPASTASRLRKSLRNEQLEKENNSTALMCSYASVLVERNPGSLGRVVLQQAAHKKRGGSSLRLFEYKWVDGLFTTSDSREGQPVTGAELISVTFVPGVSLAIMQASNAVDSIDYGRLLYSGGGGEVTLVTQVMKHLVPLGFHYCQIENVEAWKTLLTAVREAHPDVDAMRRSIISDRLAGADEMIEKEWGPDLHKYRLYCAFHLLLNLNDANLNDGAGKVKDENLWWEFQGSRNEVEFKENLAKFVKAHPKHEAQLLGMAQERYVFGKVAAAGGWTAHVRSSRAEMEFGRGTNNDSRSERGVYVVERWVEQLAGVISDIKKEVQELHAAGKALVPDAATTLAWAKGQAMQYVAGKVTRRSSTGRAEAGTVRHQDAQHGEPVLVDLICRPSIAGRAADVAGDPAAKSAIASGEVGRTGYCSQCHGPDARGEGCPHLLAFVMQEVKPAPEDLQDSLTALFHRSYRVRAIKEALDSVAELVVPTVNEVPDLGHEIAPLKGKRPPGRPKKERMPAGRKPKRALVDGDGAPAPTAKSTAGRKPNDPVKKRLKLRGEENRNEARRERAAAKRESE